jgi:serine/threonine protein kinase
MAAPIPDTSNLEGRTLAKYEIGRILGKGNMGTVYLAHDPFGDRDVAIKVAHAAQMDGDTSEGRLQKQLFFNEAHAAGMLQHPNITAVIDAGIDGEIYYIVMEYVPGNRTIANFTSVETLLTVREAVRIIHDCALALDYAHKKGVIHQDIKPRNILLTDSLDPKIADFGVAFIQDRPESKLEGWVGSPLYMSPEQVRKDDITPQSDIFSLGVVLYETLTAKNPFKAENLEAVHYHILHSPPAPLADYRSEIPDILQRVVIKALAKNARNRYKTAVDLAGDLSLVVDFIEPAKSAYSRQDRFRAVRRIGFFQRFSDAELWELLNASTWDEPKGGVEIVSEGKVDKSFFVIVSGVVQVHKAGVLVDTLADGDFFGEMGFISGAARSASVITQTDCALLCVKRPLLDRASLNCQLLFHKQFLNTMIGRLARSTDRIVDLARKVGEGLLPPATPPKSMDKAMGGTATPARAMGGTATPSRAMDGTATPAKAMGGTATPARAMDGTATPARAMDGSATPPQAMDGSATPARAMDGTSTPLKVMDGTSTSTPAHLKEGTITPIPTKDGYLTPPRLPPGTAPGAEGGGAPGSAAPKEGTVPPAPPRRE